MWFKIESDSKRGGRGGYVSASEKRRGYVSAREGMGGHVSASVCVILALVARRPHTVHKNPRGDDIVPITTMYRDKSRHCQYYYTRLL